MTTVEKEYDLTRVHEASLKLLKEIDRICRKYRIRYALDSGTLLGAIRHKGFIPWDDDADVIFTRPQYEMFLKVVERELPEGMSLLRPEQLKDGRAFYDFTARVIYDNSRMHPEEDSRMQYFEGKLNHLWVDLFVLDRLPDHPAAASTTLFLQKAIYGLSMAHRDDIDYSKYNPVDRLRVRVLSAAGRLVPMPFLYKLQRMVARKDRKKQTKYWYCSNYAPDYFYVREESAWCEKVIDVPFEDTVLMAPAGFDPILKLLYGDYMQLPPEEKRVPAHSTIEIEVQD